MNKDIRWKQRFQNFEKAFHLLEVSKKISNPSDTERVGLIQFFEVSFELAWKTLKDYLESQGFQVNSPRETIKQAFQMNLLQENHIDQYGKVIFKKTLC
jgi:nucleotidyltransferase substrate binding protein (TIGR01987 family)